MLSKRPWQPELVIIFLAAQFASLCLAGILGVAFRKAGVSAFQSEDSFASMLLMTLSMQGVTWILMAIFLRMHRMAWRDAFGLGNANLINSILLAVGLVLPVLLVVLPLQMFCHYLLVVLGIPVENERAVQILVNAQSHMAQIYFAAFAVVIAPVAEEFIFRGMLFPLVKQAGWPKTAWVGVSLLFALIHFDAAAFLPLFVLALVLTWVYDRTDCLLAPIIVHSLFNAANLVLLFWQIFHPPVSPS